MPLKRTDFPQKFIDLFIGTMGLSNEEFERFILAYHREFVPKKGIYLREGEITIQKAYLAKGCSRSYTIDESGKEHILFFAFEDWWLGDLESYHTQKPGKINVQALEDCELLCISRRDFEDIKSEIPKLQQWDEIKTKKAHFATLNRLMEIKSGTPEERYMRLLQSNPQVLQRVPQKYIAAYLDIEPQSLSRLRKRIVVTK